MSDSVRVESVPGIDGVSPECSDARNLALSGHDRPSASVALESLDHFVAMSRDAEVGLILSVSALVDLYEPVDAPGVAGAEREYRPVETVDLEVGEFLGDEIAARMGTTGEEASALIEQVISVRERFPQLWDGFLEGKVKWWQAATVASRCARLNNEAAAIVDDRIGGVLGVQPWPRLWRNVRRWILQVDRDLARQKQIRTKARRGVWVDRVDDGSCTLWGVLDPRDAVALDHVLNQMASKLPEPDPVIDPATGEVLDISDGQLKRASALGQLARAAMGQEPLPAHTLVVHIDADEHLREVLAASSRPANANPASPANVARCGHTSVASVEGWGDILADELPGFLKDSRVTVRPVVDVRTIEAADSYAVPEAMRFAVQQRNPVDVFPYGTRNSRHCDLDHTVAFRPGVKGQTRPDNLGPLSRRHHRLKTHGGWSVKQRAPGVFHWRSRFGAEFIVTRNGTVRIPPDG